MKKLSRLLLALGLALCISLTAYAEDAPAAQPTAKARPLVMPMAARSISTSAYIKKRKIQPFSA